MGRSAILPAFVVSAVICAAWTVFAGKDLNWDLLHYHYYVAHSLLGGRINQDYFAASSQSYLNPVGYLPFYLMVMAGWHSVLVSVLFAAVHGANLALLYRIAWSLLAHRRPVDRLIASALAAALGTATAVFWATVGTSFLDPLLTVPMLAGVLLFLGARNGDAQPRAAWAGILFGAAAALKYSNALFALAAVALVARARPFIAYTAGVALGVAAFGGFWFLALYREFGNPVFPLLNAWFRSPDFPPLNMAGERFAPQDLADALLFPFRMASHTSMTYAEISAPDIRYAALCIVAAALGANAMLRRRYAQNSAAGLGAADMRLLAFFALASALWIWTSANGRYGLFVLLLAGPCLVRLVDRLLPLGIGRAALCLLLLAQIVACTTVSTTRWFVTERWSRQWFPFAVPERAKNEPALYLTVEAQAMGVIVPFLHPGSSFMNLRGQHSLSPGWKRVGTILAHHEGPVRVLGRGLRMRAGKSPRPDVIDAYDSTLLRFGYRIDPSDCFAIPWLPDDRDIVSRWANALSGDIPSRERFFSLASCALRKAARDPREVEEEQRISRLFDRIERGCPRLFRGQTSITERLGNEWSRNYIGLEARIETHSGRVVLVPFFRLQYVDLGNLSDWESGSASSAPPCREAP